MQRVGNTIDTSVLGEDLVERADGRQENDSIHGVEKTGPSVTLVTSSIDWDQSGGKRVR